MRCPCPDCYGTGHERPYEPWADCPTCDGSGTVEDDDLGENLVYGLGNPDWEDFEKTGAP